MSSLFDEHREAIRAAGGDAWDDVDNVAQAIEDMRLCRSEPTYKFTVLGRAQQRGSKKANVRYDRNGKPVTKNGRVLTFAKDDNHKSKDWMQEVKWAAIKQLGKIELLTGPIELAAWFYFARPQSHFGSGKNSDKLKPSAPVIHAQSPDLAKLLRSLEDACTGVVWRDDRQVFRYGPGTGRYWTETQERTEVNVRLVER